VESFWDPISQTLCCIASGHARVKQLCGRKISPVHRTSAVLQRVNCIQTQHG
jgi:hypothetical protein